MWGRTGPAISSSGTMYTGTGDGRWDPENGIYGNGIIGVKQDPQTKALVRSRVLYDIKNLHAGSHRRTDDLAAAGNHPNCVAENVCRVNSPSAGTTLAIGITS